MLLLLFLLLLLLLLSRTPDPGRGKLREAEQADRRCEQQRKLPPGGDPGGAPAYERRSALLAHHHPGGGGPKNVPCRFWAKPSGCIKGAECTFKHERKQGACTNCGATDHSYKQCTRPKKGDKNKNRNWKEAEQGNSSSNRTSRGGRKGCQRVRRCRRGRTQCNRNQKEIS